MTAQSMHRQDDGVIDSVAIERRLAGERQPLTTRELIITVKLAHYLGVSDITKTLRINNLTMLDYLERKIP